MGILRLAFKTGLYVFRARKYDGENQDEQTKLLRQVGQKKP